MDFNPWWLVKLKPYSNTTSLPGSGLPCLPTGCFAKDGTVTFLLADHLGSTVGTVNSSGNLGSSTKYTAFGGTRGAATTSTDYLYTGQRAESEIGLYFYNARFYDPALARFIQADTIVPQPGDIKSYDRYAYVYNNPINYNDPTGHMACDEYGNCFNNHEYWNINGQMDLSQTGQANILLWLNGYGNGSGLSNEQKLSYNTFVEVVSKLGSVPNSHGILSMTVMSEYYIYANYNGGKAGLLCQEAIARNYYHWCNEGQCIGTDIFGFMSGFKPWFNKRINSPKVRAENLIRKVNEFNGDREKFNKHIDEILQPKDKNWFSGISSGNFPWQFYGPLIPMEGVDPTFGESSYNTALLNVDIANGYFFWIFTYNQDKNFDKERWISN